MTLAARGVGKRYGSREVLHDVDLQLAPGQVIALLGPNGSGKTTLMSIMVGLTEADRGEVVGDRRRCGWVPQGGGVYSRLTVRENLVLFAALLGIEPGSEAAARESAHDAGLEDWYEQPAWQLSGGLRQRLNIAVGLLGDPPMIVLDEPTTGVDLYHRHAMWKVLRARADADKAVLYSTHSLEDAAFADSVCILVGGQVAYAGELAGVARFAAADDFPHVTDPIARGMLALWGAAE